MDPSERHVPSDWANEIRFQAVKTALLVQVHDEYSSNSFRLMAMAVGVIPNVTQLDLVHMTQRQVEAHVTHMELLCLMVLTNNIRPDSKETISELQEGYVVMLSKHIPCCNVLQFAMSHMLHGSCDNTLFACTAFMLNHA